jgi:hypothetical protein
MKTRGRVFFAVLGAALMLAALGGCIRKVQTVTVVITPVAGSFKPGYGHGKTACCPEYIDAIRFSNGPTPWWPQPKNGVFTSAFITNISGLNYTATPADFEVSGGAHLGTPWCTNLPHSPRFPVTKGEEYQFLIYFSKNKPPANQNISFDVVWEP